MLRAALVTPLSGPLGGYGRAGAAALSLWAAWRGRGVPAGVELTVADAHPDPGAAVQRAERRAPDLLFGPYGSSTTAAVAGATSRLVWNHGGARVAATGNLVSVLAPADSYFRGAVRAVREADPALRTLYVLSSDTGFSRAVAAGAVNEAGRLGLPAAEGTLPVADGGWPAGVDEEGMLLVAGPFQDEATAARRLLPGRWRAAGFVGAGVEEVLAGLGAGREGLLGPAQWLAEAATSRRGPARRRVRRRLPPPYRRRAAVPGRAGLRRRGDRGAVPPGGGNRR